MFEIQEYTYIHTHTCVCVCVYIYIYMYIYVGHTLEFVSIAALLLLI